MGCFGKEDDLHEGAAEAVQLPQREADDLLLLSGNSTQDIGIQGSRLPAPGFVQSTGKWSATQISNQQSQHTGCGRGKIEDD